MTYLRRSIPSLVIPFSLVLTTCVLLFCAGASAQSGVPSRWANVSGWKGKTSVSGSGSGQFSKGCYINPSDYTNSQNVEQSPELKGMFPQWFGPAFTGQVSLAITDNLKNTCSAALGVIVTCFDTITGLGGITTNDDFQLTINTDGTYTPFAVGRLANAVEKEDCSPGGTEMQTNPYPWGPTSGPSGSTIPLLDTNYPLPSNGVHLKMTVPTFTDTSDPLAIPWDIAWDFSPACKVDVSKLIPRRQDNPDWENENYDHSDNETIGTKGCAMTSLSMALYFAGVTDITTLQGQEPNDPGALNFYMQHQDTDYNFTQVNWDATVRDVSGGTLKFNTFGGFKSTVNNDTGAKQDLDYALCGPNPHPVIVGVTGSDGSFPGHFVLVTGRTVDDTYTILDPIGKGSTLDDYGGKFQTRGAVVPVVDPPGQSVGALDLTVGKNVSLLITDPNGKQTGLPGNSAQVLQDIPESAYLVDSLTNDLTGAAPTEISHSAEIFQPVAGRYSVTIYGFATGPYQLSIRAFSEDGSSQPPILLQGSAESGSVLTYFVNYTSMPGSTSTVTPLPGDRNGDGVVNCTDLNIVKASFGKSMGQPGFDPRADVNADGVVNIIDLATVAKALPAGTTCP